MDIEELKKRTAQFSKDWKKKFGYLSESISRSGLEGATHWLKSHHQIEQFEEAIEDLLLASEQDDFHLAQVATTFEAFVIPEEDAGQADWYRAASAQLDSFEKRLIEDNVFDKSKAKTLINELKFISEANEFHERYQLQSIQSKVRNVYQKLVDALKEYQTLEREKLQAQKDQEKLKLAEIEKQKAEALAKKAMMENVKIKEKRLAIVEDKKRKIAEKELLESQNKQEIEMAEVKAKQAEHERQAKLQDAYVDLQLEEKINGWSVSDIADLLQKKAADTEIDDALKTKINALIIELKAR